LSYGSDRGAPRATTCGNCLEALYAAMLKQMKNHVCLPMLGWATITRYVRAISQNCVVYRHNPPLGAQHQFTLSRKEWSICHRVLGKYYPQ
jgi:hypothetical protein